VLTDEHGSSPPTGSSRPRFAQRPEKWRRRESNPRKVSIALPRGRVSTSKCCEVSEVERALDPLIEHGSSRFPDRGALQIGSGRWPLAFDVLTAFRMHHRRSCVHLEERRSS